MLTDRTSTVPAHDGRNIFPCTVLFSRLLRLAHRNPPKIAIRDLRANTEKTHLDLLVDVLAVRETLRNQLGSQVRQALAHDEEVYIAIIAPGSYEFAVAILAVLALGAIAVPMTPALPVEEAMYFVTKSHSVAVLVSASSEALGGQIEARMRESTNPDFQCISVRPHIGSPAIPAAQILVSSDRYLDDNKPGVVIFTSGTSGPPKGSAMRRAFVHDCSLSVAEHFGITSEDTLLHVLPVHHATGIGIMFFPFLISGALLEFRSGSFDERWIWERWRQGACEPSKRLTFFSGVPTIYMRMMRYYRSTLSKLSEQQLQEYIAGARQFRACLCGTSALPTPINQFWTDLMQKRIMQRYGGSEFGAVIKMRPDNPDVPDGSVGEVFPGVDLKLSEGDEGEVLVKSPYMFCKYIFDPVATANAHTPDGYYRTGDIARREGKFYWIVGRASLDIIKSGGYKISALDIEREVLALPYISEVMAVGVPDDEFGQRVAVAVTLLKEEMAEDFSTTHGDGQHVLTLDALRTDLRSRLASYKMPTLLRVVEGDFPKTVSGKVVKKVLGPKFFPQVYEAEPAVQVWNKSRNRDTKL